MISNPPAPCIFASRNPAFQFRDKLSRLTVDSGFDRLIEIVSPRDREPQGLKARNRKRFLGFTHDLDLPMGSRWQVSSGVTFRRAVLKVGGGERQCLLNVVRLQFRIVPEEVVPVRILRHGFHHSTNRQPHATDTRLAVHLIGVPGYAIKGLHPSYSDTFRIPSRRRHHSLDTPFCSPAVRAVIRRWVNLTHTN